MNKKIKLLNVCLIIVLSIFLSTISLATDEEISTESEENYISNYEEYENLIADTGSEYSQDELKHGYEEYQKEIKAYYNEYKREDTVKAKVLEVLEVEAIYELNEYYYSFSKYEIQPITVKILEGEYKGQTFSFEYLLTGDALNNIRYSELKAGDTIFVTLNIDETTGEVYADITNAGSNVDRFGIVLCIGIIALILMIVYGGKNGIIAALITILVLDFCLIIIPNMGFMGSGFVIGGIALILLLILTVTFFRLGFNKPMNTLKAIVISIILTIITSLLLIIANYLTRTVGITFEVAAVAENVILGNMNFESLYIVITMIIATFGITNIVCKSIDRLSKSDANSFVEKLDVCKDILGSNVLYVVVTIMALYIPNHLLLLTNKYSLDEIWNAEILATELIRLFIIIISMSLTIPTVVVLDDTKERESNEEKNENN